MKLPRSPSPARSLLLVVLACGTPACRGEPPPAFTVAGVEYRESELLGLSESRRTLLAELTAFAAIVAEGRGAEFVQPRVDSARLERVWDQIQAERILAAEGFTDAALEARYRSRPAFELTVRHLLVFADRFQADAVRDRAHAKATRALERTRAGEPFPEVAAEVSDEPGAESREGLLNPGREGSWVPEFWNAALALQPGEISGVVETQYGFHVLRLEGRDTIPFSEARDRVALEVARLIDPLDAPAPAPDSVRALAAQLGVEPDPARLEELRREWELEVEARVQLLGIPPDLSPGRVKEAALRALGAGGQNAELARDWVQSRRSDLDRIHPLPEELMPTPIEGSG